MKGDPRPPHSLEAELSRQPTLRFPKALGTPLVPIYVCWAFSKAFPRYILLIKILMLATSTPRRQHPEAADGQGED